MFAAHPALAMKPVEGKHFYKLQMDQPTEVPQGKVEVLKFFWYGCPACDKLEAAIKESGWARKLPGHVHFRKMPAIFRDSWEPGARIFYTLESMNLLDKHHEAVFNAIHREKINLNDERVLFDWIARRGVDRKSFVDTYKSFSVSSKVTRARNMTQEYGIGGVPAIIVGGKYQPAPNLSTFGDVLQVVDGLIEINRAEIGRK